MSDKTPASRTVNAAIVSNQSVNALTRIEFEAKYDEAKHVFYDYDTFEKIKRTALDVRAGKIPNKKLAEFVDTRTREMLSDVHFEAVINEAGDHMPVVVMKRPTEPTETNEDAAAGE